MVAIAHIKQFITDNPILFGRGRGARVLRKALSLGDDPILAGQAKEILGKDADALFKLIETNHVYIKISLEQAIRINQQRD